MDLLIASNYGITSEKWSIVISCDGKVKAISLERVTGIKNFPKGDFFGRYNYTKLFISSLKKITKNIDLENITNIFVMNFPIKIEKIFPGKEISYHTLQDHHLLHAYSAFFPSFFKKTAILVIDGGGYEKTLGKELCYSIRKYNGNNIENIFLGELNRKTYKLGVGYIYALHTVLLKMGEGSIMGLSGYGNNKKFDKVNFFGKDSILKDKYRKIFRKYENNKQNFTDIENILREIYLPADNDEFISNKLSRDIAARLQYCTEKEILKLAKKARKMTGYDNLCIAGGVGLNILANTSILKKKIFKNIFVQPACDDSGLSLGAIYYLNSHILRKKEIIKLNSYGLGETFSDTDIIKYLDKYKGYISYTYSKDIYNETSNLLIDSKIIGWFQGGSEFGHRALGFRSILARSDSLSIRNKINKIKNREYWRPIAPMVLDEELENYFDTDHKSPFMLFNGRIKKNKFSKMIGVSHCDFTARYQSINVENNHFMYELLSKFYKKSGIPILINTSLNQRSEPIVENPEDAIKMFISTELDNLIIGNFVISKTKINKSFIYSYEKTYSKFFNEDIDKLKILNSIIFNNISNDFKSKYSLGKIIFTHEKNRFSLSLIEENLVLIKKNILLNFEIINDNIKEKIIYNIKNKQKEIGLILLYFYKDFLNENDITELVIEDNNFKL